MANETKHTPGPWAVEPAEDFGAPQRDGTRAILSLYINAPEGGHGRIGQCFSNCLVSTDEELRLNAALFAAAPELLAACKEQHKAIDYLMARLIALDPEFRPTQSLQWKAVAQGHAAILRATGA